MLEIRYSIQYPSIFPTTIISIAEIAVTYFDILKFEIHGPMATLLARMYYDIQN